MNRKRRKEKKKKLREKKALERVQQRRKWIRNQAREIKVDQKWQKHFEVKGTTIRNDPQVTPQTKVDDPSKVEYVRKKLEHNMRILEALEAEIEQEDKARAAVNENLESVGAMSFREKMDRVGAVAENEVEDGKYDTKEGRNKDEKDT